MSDRQVSDLFIKTVHSKLLFQFVVRSNGLTLFTNSDFEASHVSESVTRLRINVSSSCSVFMQALIHEHHVTHAVSRPTAVTLAHP